MSYINHFAERVKLVHPHITLFVDLLNNLNTGVSVTQEVTDGKYNVFRIAKIDSVIFDTDYF